MPSANHAIKGSGGFYCCRCSSSVGDAVKVQPVFCDGDVFCPRCMVWFRMHQPDEQGTHGAPRFNAAQCCVAKCSYNECGWTAMCFGAPRGGHPICGNCGRPGAVPIMLKDDMFTKEERDAIAETVQAGLKAANSA